MKVPGSNRRSRTFRILMEGSSTVFDHTSHQMGLTTVLSPAAIEHTRVRSHSFDTSQGRSAGRCARPTSRRRWPGATAGDGDLVEHGQPLSSVDDRGRAGTFQWPSTAARSGRSRGGRALARRIGSTAAGGGGLEGGRLGGRSTMHGASTTEGAARPAGVEGRRGGGGADSARARGQGRGRVGGARLPIESGRGQS